MKRTLTRMVSAVCAAALGIGCFSFGADAKVIEPEIVKTESWTTSYYIDDDMDTLYPYIQCEADIYNDGTIKLYMWNTHEWDGFATVSHTATIINTRPVSQKSMLYAFYKNEKISDMQDAVYIDESGNMFIPSTKEIYDTGRNSISEKATFPSDQSNPYLKLDLSFYPKEYSFSSYRRIGTQSWSVKNEDGYCAYKSKGGGSWNYYCFRDLIEFLQYKGALPQMSFYSDRSNLKLENYNSIANVFTPLEDPTGTYNFRLYGHDITITPELLSGNIVAEPELTEQEQKIKQLEAENAALKAQLAAFDSDADGLLTTSDAQMILIYYTEYLAGAVSGTTGDYAAYIKQFKGQ